MTEARALPVNVNGPIPAILLDLGWPLAALKGIGLLCRAAGLIGHLTEEAERPIGFIRRVQQRRRSSMMGSDRAMQARSLFIAFSGLVIGAAIGFAIAIVWHGREADSATASSTSPRNPQASTTIEDILADPAAYSGKQVRLAGQLDECAGWECSLCPAQMTMQTRDPAKCLPLSFRSLIPGTGFGSGEQEDVLRFSDVVLTARFDPTCLSPGRCLDRQVVLQEAEAISVGERRSSRSGLWIGDTTPLEELGEPLVSELRTAALEAGFPENPPFKAFATIGDEPHVVVCWTPPIDPASWPNTLEGALHAPSTKDFYDCRAAREISGRWVTQAIK